MKEITAGIEHQAWAKAYASTIAMSCGFSGVEEKKLVHEIIEKSLINKPNNLLKFIKLNINRKRLEKQIERN
jgi:hypothetical protein